MRRTTTSVGIFMALASAGIVLAPPASAGSGPLAGTWVSTDTDGSDQTLRITGSGRRTYAVTYYDESATSACAGNPARISGPATVKGDTLHHIGPIVCLPGGNVIKPRIAIDYSYNSGSDTLEDSFGIVWHRAS